MLTGMLAHSTSSTGTNEDHFYNLQFIPFNDGGGGGGGGLSVAACCKKSTRTLHSKALS